MPTLSELWLCYMANFNMIQPDAQGYLAIVAFCCLTCSSLYYISTLVRPQCLKYAELYLDPHQEDDARLRQRCKNIPFVNKKSTLREYKHAPSAVYKSYRYCSSLHDFQQWSSTIDCEDAAIAVISYLALDQLQSSPSNILLLVYCDPDVILKDSLSHDTSISASVNLVKILYNTFERHRALSGLVFRLTSTFNSQIWNHLCEHFRGSNLAVYVESRPGYADLTDINFDLTDGVVLCNASVLDDGSRRDYFQGATLRKVLGRCKRQRRLRPQFVTVFHDSCEDCSSSVLKRAFNFARSHEAILYVATSSGRSLPRHEVYSKEPLSAFAWLKRPDMIQLRNHWYSSRVMDSSTIPGLDLTHLEQSFPGIFKTFEKVLAEKTTSSRVVQAHQSAPTIFSYDSTEFRLGLSGCIRGCHNLGHPVEDRHATTVLQGQARLREKNLLQELDAAEYFNNVTRLQVLCETYCGTIVIKRLLQDLVCGLDDGLILVYQGLDAAYNIPEEELHLWSVCNSRAQYLDIYVSMNCPDTAAVILHTFLSAHGLSTYQCFELEMMFESTENEPSISPTRRGIPRRVITELDSATPNELLRLLLWLSAAAGKDCDLSSSVSRYIRGILLEETTRVQLRKIHGYKLLSGETKLYDVYQARIKHFETAGTSVALRILPLVRMHREIERIISRALKDNDERKILLLTGSLCRAIEAPNQGISLTTDLLTLMVVCAFCKLASEEIHIEVSDRSPIYQFQSDQPGVFAEMWVTGSRCVEYLDMTANELGALLQGKRRADLQALAPSQSWGNARDTYQVVEPSRPEGLTSEQESHVADPVTNKHWKSSRMQKFSYFTIIALMGVTDLVLIVSTGTGITHSLNADSTSMRYIELSILSSVCFSSGTMSWAAISGEYYMSSAAFDCMNHSMLQKFAGNLLLCSLLGAILGRLLITLSSWRTGMAFFVYHTGFTAAFSIVVLLGNMHMNGSPFPSGRKKLCRCLPILTISPILSAIDPNHATLYYVIVMNLFSLILYITYRNLCREWSKWSEKIVLTTEIQISNWYEISNPGKKIQADYEAARHSLEMRVKTESRFRIQNFYRRTLEKDRFVDSLVKSFAFSEWLLERTSKAGVAQPKPFSQAFHSSLKDCLQTHQKFVKGLKGHSSYLQFRIGETEVFRVLILVLSCFTDLFVQHIGFARTPKSEIGRIGYLCALIYLLMLLVVIDYYHQFCKATLPSSSTRPLRSQHDLENEQCFERTRKRHIYRRSLVSLAIAVAFSLGSTSLLLLSRGPVLVEIKIYCIYIACYTLISLTQLNRLFISGKRKGNVVIAASIAAGLVLGLVVQNIVADHLISEATWIGLAISSVLGALITMSCTDHAGLRGLSTDKNDTLSSLSDATGWRLHSQRYVGIADKRSSSPVPTMSSIRKASIVDDGLVITPDTHTILVSRITDVLRYASPSDKLRQAFPDWKDVLEDIIERLQAGKICLMLQDRTKRTRLGIDKVAAIGWQEDSGQLMVCLALHAIGDAMQEGKNDTMPRLIAEALVHEVCEVIYEWSHSDATCAEMLLDCSSDAVPLRMQHQIISMKLEVEKIIQRTTGELLKHACLGTNPDLHWSSLEAPIRQLIIARITKEPYEPRDLTRADLRSYQSALGTSQVDLDWQQCLARHDSRATLACNISNFCKTILAVADNSSIQHEVIDSRLVPHKPAGSIFRRMANSFETIIFHVAALIDGDGDLPRELSYSLPIEDNSFLGPLVLRIWTIFYAFTQFVVYHTLLQGKFVSIFLPTTEESHEQATGKIRTEVWKSWLKSACIDGFSASFLDFRLLRAEKCLRSYWKARDSGRFDEARKLLDDDAVYIAAQIGISPDVSEMTLLPLRLEDLYAMSSARVTSLRTYYRFSESRELRDCLSVLNLDTGCYPDQPGGVSNCRRDLVNGLSTIRHQFLCETTNDSSIPRFQVERNVESLKMLPLYGLDQLTPFHGLYQDLSFAEVMAREQKTREDDIIRSFLPNLKVLVTAARSTKHTDEDLIRCAQAFVDWSIYFEEHDYTKTWRSALVIDTWRQCWIVDTPGCLALQDYLAIELPSLSQLDEALELWIRYCFVFSVRIPREVPKVFQSTHHGVSCLYGMLLKIRRGTQFLVWDHAIYWREACLNLSYSQSGLSNATSNMLLGLIKLASQLAYKYADIITPCTKYFNPSWEIEIGSNLGHRVHRNAFARKIEPIVNGITNMDRLKPNQSILSGNPTAVMLSNVQFIKDIKNAVRSADIIVNTLGFKKYNLLIYGALDRDPDYVSDIHAMIHQKSLGKHVRLAGFGDPADAVKHAWIFLNSSLSEGLPLAIGEAALSGCPIVATDVGSTASVITDAADDSIRYGELVPPNDSHALAIAQIRLLAMLGPWSKFCGEEICDMPRQLTEDDIEWITKRMYEKTEQRRALGLKGREVVIRSFNGERYLREHEQMYWLASFRHHDKSD